MARRRKQKLMNIKLKTRKKSRILLVVEYEASGVRIVVHVGGMSVARPGEVLRSASLPLTAAR